ncbi:Gti1/Pac2 family-domain-containing protein [Mycena rosella]|uniref:Gti1/Pac2 family-domain-containing protein n=1 Tax=Mycena rosella TaxID=1033263 RepID=A0AAD7CPH8_MYCRO|nr:Gti1/Pac2 family-domain-containing protein [Mycena rosella]
MQGNDFGTYGKESHMRLDIYLDSLVKHRRSSSLVPPMPMQRPTCTGIRVRSPTDAHTIFHGVMLGILPMITRRLDTEERRAIVSGCVYVWEERGGPNTEPMGLGIERWTDSIRWGPSRVREEFLFYHERDPDPIDIDLGGYDSDTASPLGYEPSHVFLRENLIKQTYSVFVETTHGRRKWHLIAYFTQDSVDYLRTVEDIPSLACLKVPPIYKSARSAKGTGRTRFADTAFAPYLYGAANNTRPSHPAAYAPAGGYSPPTCVIICGPLRDEILAPLEYLENIPPTRRHPEDEKALMSFVPGLT